MAEHQPARSELPTPCTSATASSVAGSLGVWADADTAGRRELIVRTALRLLQEEGLAAVTMRSVAGQLGVGTMTLYTYVDGQHGLHREMVRRGFEMLACSCDDPHAPSMDPPASDAADANLACWVAGARKYLRFAVENPNLYKLMFDHPMSSHDNDLLQGGFQCLLDKVTEELRTRGIVPAEQLTVEARRRAGRYWIALHGLASITIAGRRCVFEDDQDVILHDLLARVAPT